MQSLIAWARSFIFKEFKDFDRLACPRCQMVDLVFHGARTLKCGPREDTWAEIIVYKQEFYDSVVAMI